MAINPSAQYPGKVNTTDPAGYPYGKAQNVTVPGDGTGTPWEQAFVNDLFGFTQALLSRDGATPTGTPEKVGASQLLTAVQNIAGSITPNLLDNAFLEVNERYNGAITTNGYLTDQVYAANLSGAGTADIDTIDTPAGFNNAVDIQPDAVVANIRFPRPLPETGKAPEWMQIGNKVYFQFKVKTNDTALDVQIQSRDSVAGTNPSDITAVTEFTVSTTGAWATVGGVLEVTGVPSGTNKVFYPVVFGRTAGERLRIVGWDLKPLAFATPIVNKGKGRELAECQRFAVVLKGGAAGDRITTGMRVGSQATFTISLPCSLHDTGTVPSVVLSSGLDFAIADSGSSSRLTSLSVLGSAKPAGPVVQVDLTGTGTLTLDVLQLRWVDPTGYILIDNSL